MSNLYELAAQHRALAEKLADMDLDEATIADTLEGEALALEDKVEAVLCKAAEIDAMADAAKAEAARLADLAKVRANHAARLRAAVRNALLLAGYGPGGPNEKRPVQTTRFRVSLRLGSVSVHIDDAGAIPAQFITTPAPEPSKALIKEALAAGTAVPGARLVRGEPLLSVK